MQSLYASLGIAIRLRGSAATVAQLVEQRFRKPQVVGSSPTRGSIAEGVRPLDVGSKTYLRHG